MGRNPAAIFSESHWRRTYKAEVRHFQSQMRWKIQSAFGKIGGDTRLFLSLAEAWCWFSGRWDTVCKFFVHEIDI